MIPLAQVLPADFHLLYIQSQAYQCKPLVVLPSSSKPDLTLKVKHLFLLVEKSSNLIIFGVEIYVYLTFYYASNSLDRHVFVSKADTTGLGTHKVKVADVVVEILKYLLQLHPAGYFKSPRLKKENKDKSVEKASSNASVVASNTTINALNNIINRLRTDTSYYNSMPYYGSGDSTSTTDSIAFPQNGTSFTCCTKLSLFTRAANEYLFPVSHKNPGKHVIDGDKLFSWWVKLIDNTILQLNPSQWECRLTIPGSDPRSTGKYIPSPSWEVGNIFHSDQELAVYTIPVFPDDPKGRFLEHLVVENRYKSVRVPQFWEELGFRQEFRLGNVVGIIGCKLEKPQQFLASIPDSSPIIVPLDLYKNVVSLIKGEDFSIKEDVVTLWKVQLPYAFEKANFSDYYATIKGLKAPGVSKLSSVQVNTLMPVRKKEKIQPNGKPNGKVDEKSIDSSSTIPLNPPSNDISGLVKRRKKT